MPNARTAQQEFHASYASHVHLRVIMSYSLHFSYTFALFSPGVLMNFLIVCLTDTRLTNLLLYLIIHTDTIFKYLSPGKQCSDYLVLLVSTSVHSVHQKH